MVLLMGPTGWRFLSEVPHAQGYLPHQDRCERGAPAHGLSTEQFPVSAYVGSSKNL